MNDIEAVVQEMVTHDDNFGRLESWFSKGDVLEW